MNTHGPSPTDELLSHTLTFCEHCLNGQDFTAAWKALGRAHALAPNRADLLSHRGRLALFLKDNKTARLDFSEALKRDVRCSAAWSGLARLFMALGEPTAAEAAAGRALGIDPADEEAAQVKAEIQAAQVKVGPVAPPTRWPKKDCASSISLAHGCLATTPRPIFSFARTQSEEHATAEGSKPASPQEAS